MDESGLLIICAGWPEDPWGLSAFRINAGTNAGRSDLGSDPRLPTQLQWARHLANGDIAALILNRDNATQHAALKFADFLPGVAGGAYHVRDLQVIPPPAAGVSNEGRSSPLLALVPPLLGPGFRLAACWNRLVETVKTRKQREETGKKWARYGLRSVKDGS